MQSTVQRVMNTKEVNYTW